VIVQADGEQRRRMEELGKRLSGLCVGYTAGEVVPVLLGLAAHYAAVTSVDAKSNPRGIPLKALRRMLEHCYFGVLRRRDGIPNP
jgi:hypothetical protein